MKFNKKYRILAIAVVLNLPLFAKSNAAQFVGNALKRNPMVAKVLYTKEVGSIALQGKHGWKKDIIKISFLSTHGNKQTHFVSILTDGKFFTQKLFNKAAKEVGVLTNIKNISKLYNAQHLIYKSGNVTTAKKVVIFSDLECPFCNAIVPKRLSALSMEKNVEIYYYDFPLEAIHPNSNDISLVVMTAREKYPKKQMYILEKIYHNKYFQWFSNEKHVNIEKIIKKYNKLFPNMRISVKDIRKYHSKEILNKDKITGAEIGVTYTPTIIQNGKLTINK